MHFERAHTRQIPIAYFTGVRRQVRRWALSLGTATQMTVTHNVQIGLFSHGKMKRKTMNEGLAFVNHKPVILSQYFIIKFSIASKHN